MRRNCIVCGAEFEAIRPHRCFCGVKCYNEYYRTRHSGRAAQKQQPSDIGIKAELSPKQVTENYKFVRAAIIEQAIYDYRQALAQGNGGAIHSLECWFLSEWGQMLSDYNGERIIERVRNEFNGGRKNDRRKQNTNNL